MNSSNQTPKFIHVTVHTLLQKWTECYYSQDSNQNGYNKKLFKAEEVVEKKWREVPPEVQLFPCSLHSLPRDGIVVETEEGNQNEDYRRNGHQ